MMAAPQSLEQSRNLKAAVRYAEKFGFAVFPVYEPAQAAGKIDCTCPPHSKTRGPDGVCTNTGKHPRTPRGFQDASRDLSVIQRWWRDWPHANIGVAVDPSKVFLLDIDPRNGGDDSLTDLQQEHGQLPDAPTVLTGGGGRHIWFKRPDIPPGFKFKKEIAPGVEVKCQQGYVVVPPSAHASGKAYDWELSQHIKDLPLGPPPAWVLQCALQPVTVAGGASTAKPTEGLLGRAFLEAGYYIRDLGPDRAAVRCPWEAEHTSGVRGDSSTIVWAPRAGDTLGHFHCSHAHCATRTWQAVLDALPELAVATAKAAVPKNRPPEQTEQTDDAPDVEWPKLLAVKADNTLKRTEGNAALILGNAAEWAGVIQYDEFRDAVFFAAPPPRIPGLPAPAPGDVLADHHYQYVGHWFVRFRGLNLGHDAIARAVKTAAQHHVVNPLTAYLDQLRWDGDPRLDVWLHHYLGADDNPATHAMGRLWLIQCVARARQPGCQADHMLVLEGAQGVGKSTAIRILGSEFYRGNLPSLRDTDKACHAIQGGWIIEVGELDALRGAEGTRVKNFLTQVSDHYRSPYAREYVNRPRRCVFVGTTNEGSYLQDPTGARRFWPVRVTHLDRHGLERDRDQLFAEAAHRFRDGEPWWPTGGLDLRHAQEERFAADEWEDRITEFIQTRPEVTNDEIYQHLKIDPRDQNQVTRSRIAGIMHRAGRELVRRRSGGRGSRFYRTWASGDEVAE